MSARGRPFEPGNKFGRGRPRGSRNKSTLLAQNLLHSYAEPVVKTCIQQAVKGDPTAMRLCMERIAPMRRDAPVKIGKLPTHTAADIAKSSEMVVQKVAAGE